MTINTVSDLPSLAAQTTPISNAVKNYYENSVALGTGTPCKTFLTADFFGTAAGIPGRAALTTVLEILQRRIADGTLSAVASVYSVMKDTVSGTYGNPLTGPVTIPSGLPGAGTYTNADDAFQTLLPIANSSISSTATAMGTDAAALNKAFVDMAAEAVNEPRNFGLAGVDFASLLASSQTSILAFTSSLPSYGQKTEPGQSAEVLTGIADQSSSTGQALVAAIREGQNNQQLDSAGINRYNVVPST